jgi:hypothetical protein
MMEATMDRRSLLKFGSLALASTAIVPLAGCTSPSWLNTALDDLPTITNIVASIISIVALGNPALTPELTTVINVALAAAKAALVTVQALIQDYKSQPNDSTITKLDAALSDLQSHLASILQIAGIKDAALQATIATGISLAISVVSAIQLLIPAPTVASRTTALATGVNRDAAKNAVPQKITVVNSTNLKMMYNVVASSCGYAGQVVK